MNWDYLAGFFDGEGNIQTFKRKNQAGRYLHRGISIRIGQGHKNKWILDEIEKFLRSNGIESKIYPQERNNFVLAIQDQWNGRAFLEKIKDKLLIKRKEAFECIDFSRDFKHTRPFTEEEKKRIIELYLAGESIVKIAKEFGCSDTKIDSNILRKCNIVRNGK